MKTVRAKFVVSSVTKSGDGSMLVNAHPVHSGSEENKSFSEHTPSGRLELNISYGKPAQELFTPGKEYYIDITEAE